MRAAFIFLLRVSLALALVLQSCSSTKPRPAAPTIIRIKGSDTMIILASLWAEEYMKLHPGMAIYVEGGGTATGVEALIKGRVDLCTASRPLNAKEARRLAEHQGSLGISFLVAKDALSVYLHPENPVHNLSLQAVKDIFSGKITNWKALGGRDEPIMLLNREPNSGTYLYFQEHVLEGRDYADDIESMPGTAAIVKAVAENPNAIGYGGIGYGENLVHCQIDGVAPTAENVRNNSYAISRYLYFYTIKPPEGIVKAFIDWVLSPAGQRVTKESGYIPLIEVP